MTTSDPGLIGLFGDPPPKSSSNPDPSSPRSATDEQQSDALVTTAEMFLDRLQDNSQSDPQVDPQPLPEPATTEWTGQLPAGSILSADGRPFTDFDSAEYKALQMKTQTGDHFFVRALNASLFVVVPEISASDSIATPPANRSSHSDDSDDSRAYLDIPVNDLKLSDFPPDHPIHKCGLSRYKNYMKKDFRFKPAYRSMLSLIFLIPLGLLTYFYPISTLNLLPHDVVESMVSAVPPQKISTGVSLFGGMLALFAFGRLLYQRHFRRYTLNPGFAKYEEGIVSRESTKIAYVNIVNYDVKQSIIGRLLNYGTLELSSAGSDGSEIEMHNVLSPRLIEVVLEGKMSEAKRSRF